MKIIKNSQSQKTFIAVVCCLHGNEKFGLRVFNYLRKKTDRYPGLQLIVANEEAVKINRRGVDGDLNRSFPGKPRGNHEERLAKKLLSVCGNSEIVLDIHTTVSEAGFLTPIFTKSNKETLNIVNLLDAKNLIIVKKPLGTKSLIGNVGAGVSLEFEKKLTRGTKALKTVEALVEDLYLGRTKNKKTRNLFEVRGVIEKDLPLPTDAKNFKFVKQHNFYPALLKDPAYMGNQGLKAVKKTCVLL